jgi:hypothetical protein
MIFHYGRFQLFQARLPVLLHRADFFVPRKVLYRLQSISRFQKVDDRALAVFDLVQVGIFLYDVQLGFKVNQKTPSQAFAF